MGKPVARLNDPCTGHRCYGSRPNDQGSPDVFVNNLPAHRQSDHWVTHCCGPACHDSILEVGDPTVFANNLQLGRVGDPVACGSAVQAGSPNVFANANP